MTRWECAGGEIMHSSVAQTCQAKRSACGVTGNPLSQRNIHRGVPSLNQAAQKLSKSGLRAQICLATYTGFPLTSNICSTTEMLLHKTSPCMTCAAGSGHLHLQTPLSSVPGVLPSLLGQHTAKLDHSEAAPVQRALLSPAGSRASAELGKPVNKAYFCTGRKSRSVLPW